MVDLKQRGDCYRVDDCRNIFDRLAVKNGVFLQVPVPSSSGGMLAIGSFAPGVSTGACPLGMSPGYVARRWTLYSRTKTTTAWQQMATSR